MWMWNRGIVVLDRKLDAWDIHLLGGLCRLYLAFMGEELFSDGFRLANAHYYAIVI